MTHGTRNELQPQSKLLPLQRGHPGHIAGHIMKQTAFNMSHEKLTPLPIPAGSQPEKPRRPLISAAWNILGIPLALLAITGLFYALHLLTTGWQHAVEWVFRLFK